MKKLKLDDTIVAISTPVGRGGIGIVRLSGENALKIADTIFLSVSGTKPSQANTYTIHYGWIIEKHKAQSSKLKAQSTKHKIQNPKSKTSERIDEVILTVMRAPKTYTREDVVEINCHSGIVPLRRILELVVSYGARIAEPGEFTRRAFINGRIDLAQAEAVLDVINATTESSFDIGLGQLKGNLSKNLDEITSALLDILANLEAGIDFPEEDIDINSKRILHSKIDSSLARLNKLLSNSEKGRILREGIKIVICGRPNVGKSSLLNAILRQERAIVTPIAGTTRDTIEEMVNIKGVPFKIVDTAGLIRPRNIIETHAIDRTRKSIGEADLVLLVLDSGERLKKEDIILINKIKHKKLITLLNKSDLPTRIDSNKIKKALGDNKILKISALKNSGIDDLEDLIVKMAFGGKIGKIEDILVSNARHISLIKKSYEALKKARQAIKDRLSDEFVTEYIKESLSFLGEITGKDRAEDLLDKIFADFCIGK